MSCVSPQPTPSMSQTFSVVMKHSKVVKTQNSLSQILFKDGIITARNTLFLHTMLFTERLKFSVHQSIASQTFQPQGPLSRETIFPQTMARVSSVQSLSRVRLCGPMGCSMAGFPAHHQLQSLPKAMSMESVMPSNHLILCHLLLLLPSIFPSIRVFSQESVLRIRWPKFQLQHQSFQ